MQLHTLRCVSGTDDPKISWKKDDWIGNHMGNPVSDLATAEFFTSKDKAILRKELLESLGCEFKVVSFVLTEIS